MYDGSDMDVIPCHSLSQEENHHPCHYNSNGTGPAPSDFLLEEKPREAGHEKVAQRLDAANFFHLYTVTNAEDIEQ